MNSKHSVVTALMAVFLMFSSCGGPSFAEPPKAGFTQAVFDEDGLNVLLKDTDCARVRFYNARRSADDKEGTVIAVAVRSDGSEYGISSSGVFYRMSDKIVGSNVSYLERTRDAAREACRWMGAAGNDLVAAEASSRVLQKMLSLEKCNGIRATPVRADDGGLTFRFAAAEITGGTIRELAGAGSSMICGDPCPAFCSEDVEYVHQ
jgi:hypothetical protein